MWALGKFGKENKLVEVGRQTPRAPAPPRGRLAHCVFKKQSRSARRGGTGTLKGPTSAKKGAELWTRCWRSLRMAEEKVQREARSFGKGDQPEHHAVPVLNSGDATRAK